MAGVEVVQDRIGQVLFGALQDRPGEPVETAAERLQALTARALHDLPRRTAQQADFPGQRLARHRP
ncbi:MAG: hypothetical protein A2882_06720 [Phenylobacterium sp. RIFCSPHIGHO2_01_FULL_70_10]|nr:MAG: hypothetical protein A2882_06720 [Phenylobacterium sp. RIFCSPHIGHO2_01_FULL_70_10]